MAKGVSATLAGIRNGRELSSDDYRAAPQRETVKRWGAGRTAGAEPFRTPDERVRAMTAAALSGTDSRTAPANSSNSRRSAPAVSAAQSSEFSGLERQLQRYPSARILKP